MNVIKVTRRYLILKGYLPVKTPFLASGGGGVGVCTYWGVRGGAARAGCVRVCGFVRTVLFCARSNQDMVGGYLSVYHLQSGLPILVYHISKTRIRRQERREVSNL